VHSAGDIFIRIIADGLVVPIVLIAAFILLRLPRAVLFERLACGVMTGLIALWFAKILSLLYQEGERPFMALGVHPKAAYLNNPGFPSDHVLFVFCITFVVWASTKNRKLSLAFLALSTLVAIGRVVALVHTPLDVLGGFACALVAATIVYGRDFYRTKLPSKPELSTISKNRA
jgi:membrane-associated phospholipid phosphatase